MCLDRVALTQNEYNGESGETMESQVDGLSINTTPDVENQEPPLPALLIPPLRPTHTCQNRLVKRPYEQSGRRYCLGYLVQDLPANTSWNCPPGMYCVKNPRVRLFYPRLTVVDTVRRRGTADWTGRHNLLTCSSVCHQPRCANMCKRVVRHHVLQCTSGRQKINRGSRRLYVVHQIDSALLARHLANW
ncbi:unnamed protein product [Ectocarpus sp. 4 AP-2014]